MKNLLFALLFLIPATAFAFLTDNSKEGVFQTRNLLYVDYINGSDTAGTGKLSFPFKTIAKALTAVSANTAANPWTIKNVSGGATPESLITWKPNVSYEGSGIGSDTITNGVTYLEAGSATGAIGFSNVTVGTQLVIKNGDNGSVDLNLSNVNATALDYRAGLVTTAGELHVNASRIYGAQIHLIQRGWITASALYGAIQYLEAAIGVIDGCMLAHYSDSPDQSAAIYVGDDSIVTVTGSPSRDPGVSNYSVVAGGTSSMSLRHDSTSWPSLVTGAVVLSVIDSTNSGNGSKPTCAVITRGMLWNTEGGSGVADILQVCQHKSDNTYAWITK